LPADGLNDMYVTYIRQANLDAMGVRARYTIEAHGAAVRRCVQNCKMIQKTPTVPHWGPMPMRDNVGMGLAVELLQHLVTARPRLRGENFIQFDSMRRPRGTYLSAWESSPLGISEGSTFSSGAAKVTVSSCPTQQRWFGMFMRGAETRMGFVAHRNSPFGPGVIVKLLEMVKEEIEFGEREVAREYTKFGAAVATSLCASLRGPEVFLLDLAGLRKYGALGHKDVLASGAVDGRARLV